MFLQVMDPNKGFINNLTLNIGWNLVVSKESLQVGNKLGTLSKIQGILDLVLDIIRIIFREKTIDLFLLICRAI